MKAALEPEQSLLSAFRIVIEGPEEGEVVWNGVIARKQVDGRGAVVGVLLDPPSIAKHSFLLRERDEKDVEQWFYSPPLRRVRRLVYASRFQPFLGTELTYQDLGLAEVESGAVSVIGTKEVGDRRCYEVQEVPDDRSVYSRIVTLLDAEQHVPVRREYYDPGGVLWRVATYSPPEMIDGVKTIPAVRVVDAQVGSATRLELSEQTVRGAELTDGFFTPSALPDLSELAELHVEGTR
jgi:hypothetical protein